MFYSQRTEGSTGLVAPCAHGNASAEFGCPAPPAVLLVDDDMDSLVLLSFVFEQFPCSVVTESSGEAALEQIKNNSFDLVMLDIQLPGISGLEVVSQLRANSSNTTSPVIAVTALARHQDQEAALSAGCNNYISKPYLIEDIEKLIGQYIKGR